MSDLFACGRLWYPSHLVMYFELLYIFMLEGLSRCLRQLRLETMLSRLLSLLFSLVTASVSSINMCMKATKITSYPCLRDVKNGCSTHIRRF